MTGKKGLGKGLNALFSDTANASDVPANAILDIDIHSIEPNQMQPRKHFDSEKLTELSESIKSFGIIQPIIVKKESGTSYSIIAGERRWRAARLAGLTTIPAVVKDYSDVEILEAALIENIQRADLNPIEEAVCYQKLIDEYAFTQEQLAKRVGKNRSFISNSLRLLSLNDKVKTFIIEGKLSMGHARTLLPIDDKDDQFDLAEKIIDDNLNVRDTEELVRNHIITANEAKASQTLKDNNLSPKDKPHYIEAAEKELRLLLGTSVNLKHRRNHGKIEIDYFNLAELDRLLILFKKLYDDHSD